MAETILHSPLACASQLGQYKVFVIWPKLTADRQSREATAATDSAATDSAATGLPLTREALAATMMKRSAATGLALAATMMKRTGSAATDLALAATMIQMQTPWDAACVCLTSYGNRV